MNLQSPFGNPQAFHHAFKHMPDEMQEAIQSCSLCHHVCAQTLVHCLGRGGPHSEPQHVRALIDCAQMCTLSADFMTRESARHAALCGVCANVCMDCARSCELIDPEDEVMKNCAEVCRSCEESCRKMALQPH